MPLLAVLPQQRAKHLEVTTIRTQSPRRTAAARRSQLAVARRQQRRPRSPWLRGPRLRWHSRPTPLPSLMLRGGALEEFSRQRPGIERVLWLWSPLARRLGFGCRRWGNGMDGPCRAQAGRAVVRDLVFWWDRRDKSEAWKLSGRKMCAVRGCREEEDGRKLLSLHRE
jgi:hypothetical protein